MKELIKKVYYFFNIIYLIILKKVHPEHIFIVGTPIHGNLGDQAILMSEINFFARETNKKVIPIELYFALNNIEFLKKYIKKEDIFLTGGGNFGTIWPSGEKLIRLFVKEFIYNKIIVFPNTFFYDAAEIEELNISRNLFNLHKNLHLFCREKYSYNFMKKNFENCNIYLIPDIVLYNKVKNYSLNRNGALLCFRKDREKLNRNYDDLFNCLNLNKLSYKITDTVISGFVCGINRKRKLNSKLEEFACSKIVFTDRLHGMVFAYLTKTPCIVYENCSYKVKGLYEWISKCNYIRLYNEKNLKNDIDILLNLNEKKACNLTNNFNLLKDLVKEGK